MDNKKRLRLDIALVKRGLADSRERAKRIIMAGLVRVNGTLVDKPGRMIDPESEITIHEKYPPYVSRGGVKLESALEHFNIDVKGLTLMDVGASTGGFTDCLLQRGAKKVIAVDVGYGQLHWKLRNDERVKILEKTNIRYITSEDLAEEIDGATIDVSFISLRLVIPPVTKILKPSSFIVALIKPQFEVGKGKVGKGGVVKDPILHHQVINEISEFSKSMDWDVKGIFESPLPGPKGNLEFFIYLKNKKGAFLYF